MNGSDVAAEDDGKTPRNELEARVLEYELDARRITSELIRLRAALFQGGSKDGDIRQLLAEMELAIRTMQATKFWRLRNRWLQIKNALRLTHVKPAPPFDFSARVAAVSEHLDPYAAWIARNTPRPSDLETMRRTVPALKHAPIVSVIVPVYDAPEVYLRAMLDSVLAQVYPHWELCIADDASPSPHVGEVLKEYADRDARIRFVRRSENGHICRASNDALALASGDFIALLDHDDALAPEALYSFALLVQRYPDVDMVYSDEDKIDDEGRRSNPFFKPDWCPDSFLTRMYTSHLGIYRRSLVESVGGFRVGFEGSQDYDLVLRITEQTERIQHIPEVLYHWRIHPGSVTSGAQAKPYAYEAALRALNEAMERRGEGGRIVHAGEDLGNYSVRYRIQTYGRVSVIIPTRDHGEDVDRCLTSVFERSTYPDFEVVLLDNGSKQRSSLQTFERWRAREPKRCRVVRYDIPFNYSKINNHAVHHSDGEYLVFLNNDTEILTDDWMEALVEQAQRRSIGAVGAKLLYADDTIQHAGVVIGIGGIAGHAFRFFPKEHPGYFNYAATVNNFTAVTAACMAVRRSVFDEVGGFDEEFAVAYNDVDFCLRLTGAGYRNVYLPHVVIRHFESKSRGYDVTEQQVARDRRERERMQHKWNISRFRDPCYNPNLTLEREDFSIAP